MRAVEKPTNTESNHGACSIHNHKLSPILPKLDQGWFCETKIGGSKERFAIFCGILNPLPWTPSIVLLVSHGHILPSCDGITVHVVRLHSVGQSGDHYRCLTLGARQKNAIGSEVEKQIIALNITDDEVSHLPSGSLT